MAPTSPMGERRAAEVEVRKKCRSTSETRTQWRCATSAEKHGNLHRAHTLVTSRSLPQRSRKNWPQELCPHGMGARRRRRRALLAASAPYCKATVAVTRTSQRGPSAWIQHSPVPTGCSAVPRDVGKCRAFPGLVLLVGRRSPRDAAWEVVHAAAPNRRSAGRCV